MTDVQAPQIFFMARLHTKMRVSGKKTPGLMKEDPHRQIHGKISIDPANADA